MPLKRTTPINLSCSDNRYDHVAATNRDGVLTSCFDNNRSTPFERNSQNSTLNVEQKTDQVESSISTDKAGENSISTNEGNGDNEIKDVVL